jgi:hypothetical protein
MSDDSDYAKAFNYASQNKGKIAKTGLKWWFWLFIVAPLVLGGLGIVGKLVLAPMQIAATTVDAAKQTATGVIKQTLNADNALDKYRKFHNLYQGMQKHKANYEVYNAKAAGFEKRLTGVPYALWSSGDKDEFNFIEDTRSNFKLAFNREAAKYNELASRMDSKFFKSVDYLPGLGLDEPLPDYIELLN